MTVATQLVFYGLGCITGWFARKVYRWFKDKKISINVAKDKG